MFLRRQTGKVNWCSHLLKNFPQFVVNHTVESFPVVNEAEVDFFLEFSTFFYDPTDVGSLVPLSFLNPACTSGSSWFEHSLALSFFGIGMKTDLFQSCGHCWVFQICWHIECSIFTASSFRIWNRSTGIPSPPLALFVVMLPKAHLTSHSRISGSRGGITLLWLSGALVSFFV